MGVSKDTARSAEDVISTPEPGETLALFYARSRKLHFTLLSLASALIIMKANIGPRKPTA